MNTGTERVLKVGDIVWVLRAPEVQYEGRAGIVTAVVNGDEPEVLVGDRGRLEHCWPIAVEWVLEDDDAD